MASSFLGHPVHSQLYSAQFTVTFLGKLRSSLDFGDARKHTAAVRHTAHANSRSRLVCAAVRCRSGSGAAPYANFRRGATPRDRLMEMVVHKTSN